MNRLLTGLISCVAVSQMVYALEVGDAAPGFKALNQDGNGWELKEHLGNKPIVIYFYPAAMTGGCTKQACLYRDYMEANDPAFIVVGVSGDSVQNLKWFQHAENLNFPLLSDPDGSVAKAFGVPVRSGEKAISRTVGNKEVELVRSATTSRWTFMISPEGKVIYKAEKVKALEDLQDILNFISASK